MELQRIPPTDLSPAERSALSRLETHPSSPSLALASAILFFCGAAVAIVLALVRGDVRSLWFALLFVGGCIWWQRYVLEKDRHALTRIIRRLDETGTIGESGH